MNINENFLMNYSKNETGQVMTVNPENLSADSLFTYKKIKVSRINNLLIISNGLCERTVDLSGAYPSTISLKNGNGTEFADKSEYMDFSFIGINMPNGINKVKYELAGIEVKVHKRSLFDSEHVKVELTVNEKIQNITFIRSYLIYTDMAVMAVENSVRSNVSPNIYWSYRGGLNNNHDSPVDFLESSADIIHLNREVVPVKVVEFQGRTDYTNNLVLEHDPVLDGMNGNLLFCEKNDRGMFFLQEAPPSSERRDFEQHDFRITKENMLFSCGWGIAPQELTLGKYFSGYRNVIGFYQNGEEQITLKHYLRKRFPQNTDKDFSITVNPWGVGGFRELVTEQFLVDEVKAAAAIGATHYQIDDGWQTGRALEKLLLHNRYVTSEFWTISSLHLPYGFENIHEVSQENGIELALWVAPSFNQEYRDWESMVRILFDFYRKYGIKMFKIDAVKIRTKLAEDNLRKMVKTLREQSKGEIIFNFDTTNGQRPGYFMFLEYGNVFLENRYVYGMGIGYHPEDVLSNFWTLAQYTRSQTLQIEIPSHEDVNHDFYTARGKIQPDKYPAEYWAAIALFANPLLWLAPSAISAQLISTYRKIMELHLKYRDRIFAGEIIPVGDKPDGNAFTGFQSHDINMGTGFLIIYRELNGPQQKEMDLKLIAGCKVVFESLSDDSNPVVKDINSSPIFELPEPASFRLYQYRAYKKTCKNIMQKD